MFKIAKCVSNLTTAKNVRVVINQKTANVNVSQALHMAFFNQMVANAAEIL